MKINQKRIPKPIPFTQEGLEKIKKEYENLLFSRKDAVARLKMAREMGDLSENGLYKAARARLTGIDHNLARLNAMIKLAKVEAVSTDTVGIGSRVTISDGAKKITYTIVGGYESDPFQKKVSHVSPIGSALLGKRVGDNVEIEIPAGKIVYHIVEISFA